MESCPRHARRIAIATIALALLGPPSRPALAQETDRDLYAAARALEKTARAPLSDPNAPADTSLDDVHAAVAAYLLVPKRYPSSPYSDDALWLAGRLSLDAFARFGNAGDREAGQRMLRRLAAGYPASRFAKLVPAALEAAQSGSQPTPPPASAAPAPAPAPPAPAPAAPARPVQGAAPAGAVAKTAGPVGGRSGPAATIRSIHRTVLPDVVRITIELDAEVAFHEERITGPDRVFLDLSPAKAAPSLLDQTLRFNTDADIVRQVRLGRHENRTTRVVLDAGGLTTYSVYALYNPYRLVIDCARGKPDAPAPFVAREKAPEPTPPPPLAAKRLLPTWARQLPSIRPHNAAVIRDAMAALVTVTTPDAPVVGPPLPGPPAVVSADLPGGQGVITRVPSPAAAQIAPGAAPFAPRPIVARTLNQTWLRKPMPALTPRNAAAIREAVASLPPPADSSSPLGLGTIAPEALPVAVPSAAVSAPAEKKAPERTPDKAPEKNSTGGFSIARQLGLGISRIVIDPGHGGHDPGAMGRDVGEAELVLDIALRLEKLLAKIQGIEVVLTRRTDEFVPLQERTAIANREGADLFLSIHANASESPQARGVETYFLNFANNLGAAGVAARENAASGQAMAALPDLVKMIALNNKLEESRDLATLVQRSMVERLRGLNKSLKDLGVKQAPFAVLIGAAMPSVLAEISFVTNAQDARQLRSSPYRQRIAEALANAVRKYQTSLKSVSTVAHQEPVIGGQ